MSHLDISLRTRIFLVVMLVIVAAQVFSAHRSVARFQNGYLKALEEQCRRLGAFLERDFEHVLGLGVPLTRLARLEQSLGAVLAATPELALIAVSDAAGNLVCAVEARGAPGSRGGSAGVPPIAPETLLQLRRHGISADALETRLPLRAPGRTLVAGHLHLRLSPELLLKRSRAIWLDILTITLVSLLVTFEALTFFVAERIGRPLDRVLAAVNRSIYRQTAVADPAGDLTPALGRMISAFKGGMQRYLRALAPLKDLRRRVRAAGRRLDRLAARPPAPRAADGGAAAGPVDLPTTVTALQRQAASLSGRLAPAALQALPADRRREPRDAQPKQIPYGWIRPLIFLFIVADAFCISFFPLYVETLYAPVRWLPREVALGLPISVFMAVFAFSMPLTGSWSERVGWCRPLLTGIVLNAAGLLLTAAAGSIAQLAVFRAITALGFGMVFMACQRFVIDNTSVRERAVGMAAFLAAFFAGDICGTVMGGVLADRIGYRSIFLLSAGVCLLALALGVLLFGRARPLPPKPAVSRGWPLRGALKVLLDREFCAVVWLQAIPAKIVLIGVLFYFVPLYLRQAAASQGDIGRVIICYGLAMVFLGPLFYRCFDRPAYRKYYIFVGGLLTALALSVFLFFSGVGAAVFLAAMLGLAHTFSVSSQAAFITETRVAKAMGEGVGMGLFRFWERVGNVAGPLVVGGLISRLGYESAMVVLAAFLLVASLGYLAVIGAPWRLRAQASRLR
ncbi:MAG: MFS transporter [Desulfobacteraceae bacterium]